MIGEHDTEIGAGNVEFKSEPLVVGGVIIVAAAAILKSSCTPL